MGNEQSSKKQIIERWKGQYQEHRCFSEHDNSELLELREHIKKNLYFHQANLKQLPKPKISRLNYWIKKAIEFNTEIELNSLSEEEIESITVDHEHICEKVLDPTDDIERETELLFRFTKPEHAESLYKTGEIELKPASFYDDTSLNPAVKDKEDEIEFIICPGYKEREMKRTEDGVAPAWFSRARSGHDFFVACFSSIYSERYHDFFGSACLKITDVESFIEKFKSEFFLEFDDSWTVDLSPVRYIDPYIKEDNEWISSHFGFWPVTYSLKSVFYSYQYEFRILAMKDYISENPEFGDGELEKTKLHIGSLEEVAEEPIVKH